MTQADDTELVRARLVQDGCPDCLKALLEESRGRYPLEGKVVLIPRYWLDKECPHGHPGLKFEGIADVDASSSESQRAKTGDVEIEPIDSRIDATRNIGYPVRENGPYGSHPMHDDFDDESDPDGSGTY